MNDKMEQGGAEKPSFSVEVSDGFFDWIAGPGCAVAFTSYKSNLIFVLGIEPNGSIRLTHRLYPRPMGIGANDERTMWVSGTQYMWRFEDFFGENDRHDAVDGALIPVEQRSTGNLDGHDVRVRPDGSVVFAATRFDCIAHLQTRYSFGVEYVPFFLKDHEVVPDDRCHLNSVELDEDGKVAYVTAIAESTERKGWREKKVGGGILIDAKKDEIVLDGLCMPHSPRRYKRKLLLLNSGTGAFGYADLKKGKFEPICDLPGFGRGIALHGDYALVTVSDARLDNAFKGLPIHEKFADGAAPTVGIVCINLVSGEIEHTLKFTSGVRELYDCTVLTGVRNPLFYGMGSEASARSVRYLD